MSPLVTTFLRIRKKLGDVRENEGILLGSLEFDVSDGPLVNDLTELQESGVVRDIRRNGALVFMPNSESGHLLLTSDLGKLEGYFETYDSLILSHPYVPPSEFVVWEEDEAARTGYGASCSLLQFLKSKVEVWDSTGQTFFLVDQQALEIPLVYSAKQTTGLSAILSQVTRFLDASHLDADTRWAFFRKAAMRLLRDAPKDKPLGVLLENLSNVFERSQQDYSLYLERFSFEDVLKTFDEKRLKFVGDLNQVLSSIQTALIAVPIAFFLVAEKFKAASGWLGQNIVLAAGGVVFFALLFILSLNQGKTLQGVKLALDDFEAEQNKKITEASPRLTNLLDTTKSQHTRVEWLLAIVRILLFLFSLVIVAALLWCSIPALQNLLPYTLKEPTASPIVP